MNTCNNSNEQDIMCSKKEQSFNVRCQIKKIMSSEIVSINPESTLYDAARIMGEKHIGSVVVVKYKTSVGILTERDLLSEVVKKE